MKRNILPEEPTKPEAKKRFKDLKHKKNQYKLAKDVIHMNHTGVYFRELKQALNRILIVPHSKKSSKSVQ